MSAQPQVNAGYAPAPGYHHSIELIDGQEMEKPRPKKLHTLIQAYLIVALAKLLPEGFDALPELDTVIGTREGRRQWICPDIVVAPKTAAYEEGRLAESPVLGVEILSPGQTMTELFVRADRLVKIGAQNIWVIWPEKRRAWEVGANQIDEERDRLTLRLPVGTSPDSVHIHLPEMWRVLD